MSIASVRTCRAGCFTAALLLSLVVGCATKSPSAPQVPAPPPASPSSTPDSSGSTPSKRPATPSSTPSSTSSSSPSGASSSSASSPKTTSSSPSASPPAPASKPASPGSTTAGSAGGGAKTEAERNAEWDEAFYGSLGEFDQRLEREQAALEQRRGEIAAAGGGRGTDAGEGGAGGISGQVPSEVATTESSGSPASGGGSESSAIGGPGGSAGSPAPRFPAPEGMPDGKDDDVVARQLREAAETEKDPELRARLWEEYRKYKSRKS